MEKYKVLMAIGNKDIENTLKELESIEIIDNDSDIDIIADVLNYEKIDFVVVNTLLSQNKALILAKVAKEKNCKVIAIVENYQQKELIAALVGLGVKAFVDFKELNKILSFIESYPVEYDFSKFNMLQDVQLKATKKSKVSVLKKRSEVVESHRQISPDYNLVIPKTSKITIAIFNICNGAGATHTAIKLAERLAALKQNVICVSLDKKQEFLFLNAKKCSAEYFIPDTINDSSNFEYLLRKKNYQIIIYDFGQIFKFDAAGNLIEDLESKFLKSEFMRCTFKIGLAFSDNWHRDKLDYFLKSEEFFEEIDNGQLKVIVSGTENTAVIQKYKMLDIFERSELNNFIDYFIREISLGG